ncbi:hypothetical protein RCOM_0537190 [Ricinus communis]|uniref:Uncharacterized protein n=1 Tax=Ricinus communis TaxID=3988 RepID=B9S6J3_RICCO|nr:hypothetical protein RCOM_0537190 [Ricinus communis]
MEFEIQKNGCLKIYRESRGTASVDDLGYEDDVQKAEAMAFRRACARFGLGRGLTFDLPRDCIAFVLVASKTIRKY